MNLSKSRYCKGIQCPKILWLDKNKPEVATEQNLDAIMATGTEVGDLAMGYFGDFVEVPFSLNKEEMTAATKILIEQGNENIAEASFYEDGLFCSVDILHKNQDGYDIVEVKSSTHVTDIYLEDMAFQYYVVTKAGIKVNRVYNLHINNKYVRHGALDLKELFVLEDCTEECLSRQHYIRDNADNMFAVMEQTEEPLVDLDTYCDQPYACAYKGYCGRHLPECSVFDVYGLHKSKMYKYYHEGIISFEDILKQLPKMSAKQYRQVETKVYHRGPEIDKGKIKEFLNTLYYPVYNLDFETFQQAIPMYDGIRPYMTIPFQYSLHVIREELGVPEHYEFLAKEGTDPRRELAESLCRDIPKDVCVLAYNMGFEKKVIRELANNFPDLAEHLLNIHDHIMDLMIPFQKQYYYCEAMEGSYSIKYVLPALCPNDPELDYHSLDEVHNGTEASNIYAILHKKSPEEIARIRKNLLAYCRLDTLAMVKVIEKLYECCK